MRMLVFGKRNLKELVRDPLSYIFCLGFPIVMLLIFTVINDSIQSEAKPDIFRIDRMSGGIAVFGAAPFAGQNNGVPDKAVCLSYESVGIYRGILSADTSPFGFPGCHNLRGIIYYSCRGKHIYEHRTGVFGDTLPYPNCGDVHGLRTAFRLPVRNECGSGALLGDNFRSGNTRRRMAKRYDRQLG